jgi:hypothetical protein
MSDEARERTEKWLEKKLGKEVIAVSRLSTGTYRGMTIIETAKGFAVMLGKEMYSSNALISVTSYIDNWIEQKNN